MKRKRDSNKDDDDDGKLLIQAVRKEDFSRVQELLERGSVHVNIKDGFGKTPLFWACRKGHLETIKSLIDHGADANIKDNYGRTPLHGVFRYHYGRYDNRWLEVAKVLIENNGAGGGSDLLHAKDGTGKTPFYKACMAANPEIVKFLIENGADFDIVDEDDGQTPILHRIFQELKRITWRESARSSRLMTIAKLLIRNGIDVNAKDKDGKSLLQVACMLRFLRTSDFFVIVGLLVENGANVNVVDEEDGQTTLHLVLHQMIECHCDRGRMGDLMDVVKILVERGVGVNVKDNNETTLLHLACMKDGFKIVNFLVESGVDVDPKDKNGKTPLHEACRTGNLEAVKLLTSRGANVDAATAQGSTPLQIASQQDHREIVWFLVRQYPWLVSERLE